MIAEKMDELSVRSPPARGWTASTGIAQKAAWMFPAPAGVALGKSLTVQRAAGTPRLRWDEPAGAFIRL